MIMAISTMGSWQHTVSDSPVNATSFAAFLDGLQFPSGSVIVMDNIAFHKSKIVLQTMQKKEFVPLYIPPYCPDANPIENVFGILKQKFRKRWIGTLGNMSQTLNETVDETMRQMKSFDKVFGHCLVWLARHSSFGGPSCQVLKRSGGAEQVVFCSGAG